MSHTPYVKRGLTAIATACLLSVSLPAPATFAKEKHKSPAASEATTSQPISIDYAVNIPSIDAVDSNVDKSVIEDVLKGNLADHAAELAALNASSVTVPEIELVITSKQGGKTNVSTVTYKDLVFEDVKDGVAGSVSVQGINVTDDEVDFNFGPISASKLDIGATLAIYGMVPNSGGDGMRTIYTDLRAEGGTVKAEDVSCTIGGVSGDEFKARPLKTSLNEFMAVAQALEADPEMTDPTAMSRFLKMYADVLTAFETSEVTFDGFNCSGTDHDDKPISFSVAGMTMGGMKPGLYPQVAMEGLDIKVDDGAISLDKAVIKPADLSSLIATLENAPERVDETWLEANARGMIPSMEGFSFSGFKMDIPDEDAGGTRIKAGVGNFDLSLADYRNGIPADMDMSAQAIQFAIPEDSTDETLVQLRDLGLKDIDAGFRFAAGWNEAKQTIEIKDISIEGANLISAAIKGTITNATGDLFSTDNNAALAASIGLGISNLDLTVVDKGLTDIIFAVVAKEQDAKPETLRPVFAGLAQGTVISVMAGAADAAKLGEAINKFVAGTAKTLAIGIKAKDEKGIGMEDFMAAEDDPSVLLGKINVSAEAK